MNEGLKGWLKYEATMKVPEWNVWLIINEEEFFLSAGKNKVLSNEMTNV